MEFAYCSLKFNTMCDRYFKVMCMSYINLSAAGMKLALLRIIYLVILNTCYLSFKHKFPVPVFLNIIQINYPINYDLKEPSELLTP